jgi:DivIVA domain-containing protein
MEISGQVLRDVEFVTRLRGYDTDEVDEFLERVAVAIDDLKAQLGAVREKPEHAEGPDLDDESLRRTLVLAQRTADLAVREAREEAATLLEDARQEAAALAASTREEAGRLRSDAERDARQRIIDLEARQAQLEREIEELGRFALAERGRISAALSAALESLGSMLSIDREPLVRSVEPADVPADDTVAMPTAPEPGPVDDEAGDGLDDDEDTGEAPAVFRPAAEERPHRQSLAAQLGLTDDDAGRDEPPRPPNGRNLHAVDSAESDDPDEALWQRWARGADLDASPGSGRRSMRSTPPRPGHRDGGWTA